MLSVLSARFIRALPVLFAVLAGSLGLLGASQAQSTVDAHAAPDAFVQAVANNALEAIRREPPENRSDHQRLLELVDQYISPYANLEKTTRLAAARHWRTATPEQQQRLVQAFKGTLLRTYSGALARVDDIAAITVQPYRGDADAQDAHIRSSFTQRNGPAVNVDYRLENTPAGWKIYDLNVEGIWLIQNYRNQFGQIIGQQGIDGLIDTLNQRNQ